MKAAELADRLEKQEENGHMNTMDTTMFLNRGLILKSLRFAADMDVLAPKGPCFTKTENYFTIRVTVGSVERIGFNDSDIYSAARAAVEALKGRV